MPEGPSATSPAGRLQYRTGDATRPEGEGAKIIAHVCNDIGKWGAGFVLAVSRRWKAPEQTYRQAFTGATPPVLGDVQFVDVGEGLTVANMIAQHGIRRAGGTPPIRYAALRTALDKVGALARDRQASVHMPRIGAGLAGGDWREISAIVEETIA